MQTKFIQVPSGPGRTRFIPVESGDGRVKGAGTHWHNHRSLSTGCHPTQVGRFRDFIRDFCLQGVEVTNNGTIKFDSRRSQKKYLQATNQYNADEIS